MPNKNGMPYLKESVNSVMKQSEGNFQLIVVDGNSTDDSLSYLTSLNDKRLTVIQDFDENGVMESRRKGIMFASGEWIAFLDSDDVWLENKLQIQVNYMKKNNIDFSYTNFSLIDHQNNQLAVNKHFHKYLDRQNFASKRAIVNSSVIIKSQVLKNNFPNEVYKGFAEDLFLWGTFVYNDIPAIGLNHHLVKYRITPGARSKNFLKNLFSVWKIYIYKFKLGYVNSFMSFFKYGLDVVRRKITK